MDDGTVKTWGQNDDGELGDGTTVNNKIPTTVAGISNVKQISAGYYNCFVLLNDGTVKAWGGNYDGELGDGTIEGRLVPITIPGLTDVKQIRSYNQTLAIMNDGTLKIWGDNYYGQLGDGTKVDKYVPTTVAGVTNVKQISPAWKHTAILLNDGTIKTWGDNSYGQLGNGTVAYSTLPTNIISFNSQFEKVPPTIEYTQNGGTNEVQVSTIVTANDTGGSLINNYSLQYKWDTQNVTEPTTGWVNCSNGGTLSITGNGTYYLWVKASDNAGNTVIDKSNAFIVSGEIVTPVSTIQTENKTFSGATTGFAYNNPVIPAGFVALDTYDAKWTNLSTDWDKGLVVKDASGNEFVWVPVDGTSVPYAKWCTTGTSYATTTDDTLPSGFIDTNITTTYQGFYIARYESMFDYNGGSPRVASKKSANKSTSFLTIDEAHTGYLWNSVTYTNSKTYAENMATSYGYDTTKVITNLITGTEWDTTLKWIQNSGKDVIDSRRWGNYLNSSTPANIPGRGSLQVSGYSYVWKAKNIYDLAGNTREWTNEKSTTNSVMRGGHYATNSYTIPAAHRALNTVTYFNVNLSFRTALFIK